MGFNPEFRHIFSQFLSLSRERLVVWGSMVVVTMSVSAQMIMLMIMVVVVVVWGRCEGVDELVPAGDGSCTLSGRRRGTGGGDV